MKRIIQKNKKALFNYDIKERFEAGIVLTGSEVKSIREGKCQLKDSFVIIRGKEAYLLNAHISRYSKDSSKLPHDPERTRKLLLKNHEIQLLLASMKGQNLTTVPLSVYTIGRNIKVEIGLARGKKQYQKREQKIRQDIKRDIDRTLKEINR